jgi:DNA-binding HxlR family transcriptional regulator
MASYVLTKTGTVVVCKSVWALSSDERQTDKVKQATKELNKKILSKIGNSLETDGLTEKPFNPPPPEALWNDLDDTNDVMDPLDTDSTKQHADKSTPEACDEYLTAEVLLPAHGGIFLKALVKGCKLDSDGALICTRNANPLLDSRQYDVEFPDGSTEAFTANLITENLLSQVNAKGWSYSVMSEIVDHYTNGKAMSKGNASKMTKRSREQLSHTTQGWEIQVEWKDGSTSWVPLKDLKESNPVELAEYAVANKLVEEPAFTWWV